MKLPKSIIFTGKSPKEVERKINKWTKRHKLSLDNLKEYLVYESECSFLYTVLFRKI